MRSRKYYTILLFPKLPNSAENMLRDREIVQKYDKIFDHGPPTGSCFKKNV